MFSYISPENRQTSGNSLLMVLDGGEMQTIPGDFDLQKQYEPQHDPEKPPQRQRGDKYYSLGALIGLIIGGISGGVLSRLGGLLMFNIIAGAVTGGILGLIVGSLLRKRVLNKGSKGKKALS